MFGMNIVLFGGSGRLGAAFLRQAHAHTLLCPRASEVDICDPIALHAYLDRAAPDLVVNATGYNAVDRAESEEGKAAAYAMNTEAVESFAVWGALRDRPVIQFSTDYVFSGTHTKTYTENSLPDPINAYGASKAEGEKRARARYPSGAYIIRTSRLFGPPTESTSLKKSFLDLIHADAEKRPRFGVNREEYASPTLVDDLAAWVVEHFFRHDRPPAGIYHAVGGGEPVTWFTWAQAYLEDARLPVSIWPRDPNTMKRAAKRPAHLALASTKLPPLRNWREAQKAFLASRQPSFTPRWHEELGLDAVRIEFQKYIGTPAGGVMHLLPGGVENPQGFGHSTRDIYAFNAQGRGQMRGGHYHHVLDELFFPMSGTALWILSDFREMSSTRGKTVACVVSIEDVAPIEGIPTYSVMRDGMMMRLRVPAGIYHAIIPLTDERVAVTAVGSTSYAKEDYAYPALETIPDLASWVEKAGISVDAIIPRKTS